MMPSPTSRLPIPPTTQFMRSKAWRDNDRVRTQGSASVVEAALTAGVGRVLQESICMLYRDSGSNWIDEDTPTDLFHGSSPARTTDVVVLKPHRRR